MDVMYSYLRQGFIDAALDLSGVGGGGGSGNSGGSSSAEQGSSDESDAGSGSARASSAAPRHSCDVRFDTSSLAYTILRGSVAARHKSMLSYSQIYQRALEEYHIRVELRSAGEGGWSEGIDRNSWDLAVGAREGAAKAAAQLGEQLQAMAAERGIISGPEFDALQRKRGGKEGLTNEERQLWWEHHWAVRRYGVPEGSVDDSFRQRFVKSFVPATVKEEVETQYRRLRRLRYAHKYDQQELQCRGGEATEEIQRGHATVAGDDDGEGGRDGSVSIGAPKGSGSGGASGSRGRVPGTGAPRGGGGGSAAFWRQPRGQGRRRAAPKRRRRQQH